MWNSPLQSQSEQSNNDNDIAWKMIIVFNFLLLQLHGLTRRYYACSVNSYI
jgi:hypothetical protein